MTILCNFCHLSANIKQVCKRYNLLKHAHQINLMGFFNSVGSFLDEPPVLLQVSKININSIDRLTKTKFSD